jgi:hypothetical protein
MSLLMTEVEEGTAGPQQEFSASPKRAREFEGREADPCFADTEFGNILGVLADDPLEIEDQGR